MGSVYKARDTRLHRTVALKILSGASALDPAARERFTREARAIAALDHPHICAVYDVGRDVATPSTRFARSGQAGGAKAEGAQAGGGQEGGGKPPRGPAIDYLVMEHLEGETLASRLKKGAS